MIREGYLVVSNEHGLFPDSTLRDVEGRAQEILNLIKSQHQIDLAPIRFNLYAQSKANRRPAVYVKALFEGQSVERIRVLVSEDDIPAETITRIFRNTELFVIIKDVNNNPTRFLQEKLGKNICRVDSNIKMVARLIEDIVIDIAIGTLFRQYNPIKEIISEQSISGLYARKVAFARDILSQTWPIRVEAGASYVMLASLNDVANDDVERRATQAFKNWTMFRESLALTGLGSMAPYQRPARPGPRLLVSELRTLRKIGKRLSHKRIAAAARTLPSGDYALVVLARSSSVRKSPSLRGKIVNLLGPHARIGSFRFFSADRFVSSKEAILALRDSGHLDVFELQI